MALPERGRRGKKASASLWALDTAAPRPNEALLVYRPGSIAVTSSWVHAGLGADADRAAATVETYAAGLLALDASAAEPPRDAQYVAPYVDSGTTPCSYQGNGCSCKVSCSGSSHAECTSCTRCVCVFGATGTGDR